MVEKMLSKINIKKNEEMLIISILFPISTQSHISGSSCILSKKKYSL